MQNIVFYTTVATKGDVFALTALLDRESLDMVPGIGMSTPGSLVDAGRVAATLFTDVSVCIVVKGDRTDYLERAKNIVNKVYCTIPAKQRRENVTFYTQAVSGGCRPPLDDTQLPEISMARVFHKFEDMPHFPNAFVLMNGAVTQIQPVNFLVCNFESTAMDKVQANVAMLNYCSGHAKILLSAGVEEGDTYIGSDGALNAVIVIYEAILAGNSEILKDMDMLFTEAGTSGVHYAHELSEFGAEGDVFYQLVAHGRKEAQNARMSYYQRALEAWFSVKKVHPGSPKKLPKTAPRPPLAPMRQPKLEREHDGFPAFDQEFYA
jgi:hypothetical protein